MQRTRIQSAACRLLRLTAGVAVALSLTGVAAAFAVLRVPADFPTIQEAIEAASVGDSILVAPGTYVENINFLGKDITVRATGGFGVTTLDGNQDGTVVVFENGETRDAVLDGFTITGGRGTVRPAGGIHCGHASPTIRNCLVYANRGSDVDGGAGGLECGFASPEVRDCVFRRNLGGAAGNPAGPGALRVRWDSAPRILTTVFEENRGADVTAGEGGAGVLYSRFDATPVFNGCEFRRNQGGSAPCAGKAGAGVLFVDGHAAFFDCDFESNAAGRSKSGPGVGWLNDGTSLFDGCSFVDNEGSYCVVPSGGAGHGAFYVRGTPTFRACEFRGNRGGGRDAAGAIATFGTAGPDILDCTFIENQGGGPGGYGGAGAIQFSALSNNTPQIVGCVFVGNVAGDGRSSGGAGAVQCTRGGVIVDSVFVDNRGGDATEGDGGPGGVLCDSGTVVLIDNCRFFGNVGGVGSNTQTGNPYTAQAGAGAILSHSSQRPVIRNCVVARNTGGSSDDFAAGAGGIEISGGDALVIHCTVVDNVAGDGPGPVKPAGLRLAGSGPQDVVNSIFWNDTGAPELIGQGTVRNCVVRNGTSGVGILSVDPGLVDPDGDDYHLGCASHCRDAGTLDVELPELDYEGDPRVVGASPDIGADEYDLAPAGSSYCVSTPNSTGTAALIDARGCNALSDGVLPLRAGPVPDTFGAFFYGTSQVQSPFGNGVRCVGGAVFRVPFVAASGGELIDTLDYAAPPQPAGQISAGSTWYFQAWFRDPAAGGAQLDLTDGLQITFVP